MITVKSKSSFRHTKQVIGYGELSIAGELPVATFLMLLLVSCGGESFESQLFVGTGGTGGQAGAAGTAGAVAVGGSAGTVEAGAGGTAGAPVDAGMDACETVNDGNACTVDVCDTHAPVSIEDGKVCTKDVCNPTTGEVTHTPQEEIHCTPCPEGWIEDVDLSDTCPSGLEYVCTCGGA